MISLEERIESNVIDQLKWDSRVHISDIEVAVCGGTVKLTVRAGKVAIEGGVNVI